MFKPIWNMVVACYIVSSVSLFALALIWTVQRFADLFDQRNEEKKEKK